MTSSHTDITVLVNHERRKVPADITLTALFQTLGLSDSGVALAVNRTVIVADQWPHTLLQHNDDIEIFQAIAGG